MTESNEITPEEPMLQADLRHVLQYLPEGVAVVDSEGIIRFLNERAQEIVGTPGAEVLGGRMLDFPWETVLPDGTQFPREKHPALVVLETGEVHPRIVLGMTSPAVPVTAWVEVSSFPLHHPGADTPYASVSSFRDVTRQMLAERALQESENWYSTLVEDLDLGVFRSDASGSFDFVNPWGCELMGLSPESALGDGWVSAIHPEDKSRVLLGWARALETRGLVLQEFRVVRPGRQVIEVKLQASPVLEEAGELSGYLGTITDVTESKELEKRKDELIGLVSHELKGPLLSVRGALQYLREDLGSLNEGGGAVFLEMAERNTRLLLRLVNGLLDLEKLESGGATLEPVRISITSAMERAKEVVAARAQKADVRIDTPSSAGVVWADEDRVLQVLNNLLTNAIKFSPGGSVVTMSATPIEEGVCLTVSDQGRGIPSRLLERIFERFEQVEAGDSRDMGGTGLGLAICKAIVERHGGRIWAESRAGEGSEFHFTLPSEPS